jgi:dipeptidyl aminopeptidase/acylaminoacyl peptidase
VLLAGLTLSPAQAAFPGQNGKIAFERGRDVWTMNSDGSGATPLTTGGGTFTPAIGPGGSRIAFNRGADIWVMNADGSGQTNLTGPANAGESNPAWSPDGSRIAFSRIVPNQGPARIWVMDADGSNQIQVSFGTSSGDLEPVWSPDGGLIAYVRLENSSGIFTVDPTQPGSDAPWVQVPSTTEDQPTWSPDGQAIAFRTNVRQGGGDDIYRVTGRNGPPQAVTSNAAADSDPTWSPDGAFIAFASTRGGGSQIWRVDASGTEANPVSLSGAATTDGQPDWGTLGAEEVVPPPTIGQTLNAEEVDGTVTVKLPTPAGSRVSAAGGGFIPLDEAEQLPIGSIFNTRRGTVRLELAASAATNATQEGTFRGGVFQTRQGRGNPLTELRMRGAGLSKCSKLPKGGAAAARRRSRRIFANTRGRFRTRGRNSTATVRGTAWVQKDTCRGTLTSVRRGSVLVRDLTKRRTIRLKKGQKYLARPPKRR